MKEILAAAGSVALALGLVAAAVFGAGDAATFVPPPESVAESFARELATGRYDIARRHLSKEQRRQSAADLRAQFEPVRERIGKLDNAEARELSRESDRAAASCELQGEPAAVTLTFVLVREQGLWKVAGWEAAADVTR